MEALIKDLAFKPFNKRPLKYKPVKSMDELTKFTYYINATEKPFMLTTNIHGKEETKKMVHNGAFILCGPFGERYAVDAHKIVQLYNINDGILTPRTLKKPVLAAQVHASYFRKHGLDPKSGLRFTAPWGEQMILEPGDYVIATKSTNTLAYYRVSGPAFRKTYTGFRPRKPAS